MQFLAEMKDVNLLKGSEFELRTRRQSIGCNSINVVSVNHNYKAGLTTANAFRQPFCIVSLCSRVLQQNLSSEIKCFVKSHFFSFVLCDKVADNDCGIHERCTKRDSKYTIYINTTLQIQSKQSWVVCLQWRRLIVPCSSCPAFPSGRALAAAVGCSPPDTPASWGWSHTGTRSET